MGPGGTSLLTLQDDGVSPDHRAGDGLYTGFVPYQADGTYHVSVTFDNDAGTAETTELAREHSLKENGEPWHPNPQPVTEVFEVSAETTLVVSGAKADDHGDTPSTATQLAADNVDVPGQMDRAGDVDLFRVTASRGGWMIVRLSGFGMGMVPEIRLLAANGTTVLEEASFAPSAEAYYSTQVTVSSGVPFFVEVSHADKGAAEGLYYVSAGSKARSPQEPALSSVYLPYVRR
jgi:hypothetical protein